MFVFVCLWVCVFVILFVCFVCLLACLFVCLFVCLIFVCVLVCVCARVFVTLAPRNSGIEFWPETFPSGSARSLGACAVSWITAKMPLRPICLKATHPNPNSTPTPSTPHPNSTPSPPQPPPPPEQLHLSTPIRLKRALIGTPNCGARRRESMGVWGPISLAFSG